MVFEILDLNIQGIRYEPRSRFQIKYLLFYIKLNWEIINSARDKFNKYLALVGSLDRDSSK